MGSSPPTALTGPPHTQGGEGAQGPLGQGVGLQLQPRHLASRTRCLTMTTPVFYQWGLVPRSEQAFLPAAAEPLSFSGGEKPHRKAAESR